MHHDSRQMICFSFAFLFKVSGKVKQISDFSHLKTVYRILISLVVAEIEIDFRC